MMELWISLESLGFPNYEVSSLGNICNLNSGYLLKGTKSPDGYTKVQLLNKNGKYKSKSIHILVATIFIEKKEPESVVDHINKNKENNRVSNLRWIIRSNKKNATHKGKSICQYDMQGHSISTWNSAKDAATTLNLSYSNIINSCKNEQPYSDFFWRYNTILYTDEVWKMVPYTEYELLYASSYGRIMKFNGDISGGYRSGNYLNITMYEKNTGNRTSKSVHRLIAAAFLGRNDNLQINHKDGNTLNNRPGNLEYMCPRKDSNNVMEHEDFPVSTYSRKVVQINSDGNITKIYNSIKQAFIETGIPQSNICLVCKGIRQTAGGYRWFYLND